jgi:hypothetical protein
METASVPSQEKGISVNSFNAQRVPSITERLFPSSQILKYE